MTFLRRVVEEKKTQVATWKRETSVGTLKEMASTVKKHPFTALFSQRFPPEVRIIAEVKKASPSKGVILQDLDVGALTRAYEEGGAAAVSIITEAKHFLGSLDFIGEARSCSTIPILRKDFVVDEYEIYQSKTAGADAVLLIGEILEKAQVAEYLEIAKGIELDVLLEVHSMKAYERVADLTGYLLGINNRDLETLRVDLTTSLEIIRHLPAEYPVIVESGISSREDVLTFADSGVSGFLIGTSLVQSGSPTQKLRQLRGKS
jgi:indole-3-glycerol phosphate synthase